jgi:hypothetical protein
MQRTCIANVTRDQYADPMGCSMLPSWLYPPPIGRIATSGVSFAAASRTASFCCGVRNCAWSLEGSWRGEAPLRTCDYDGEMREGGSNGYAPSREGKNLELMIVGLPAIGNKALYIVDIDPNQRYTLAPFAKGPLRLHTTSGDFELLTSSSLTLIYCWWEIGLM